MSIETILLTIESSSEFCHFSLNVLSYVDPLVFIVVYVSQSPILCYSFGVFISLTSYFFRSLRLFGSH